jgi:hypothetical protein
VGKKNHMTLRDLLEQHPSAEWALAATSARLLTGNDQLRLTRRVVFDGTNVFAGRVGLKTRTPWLRLVCDPAEKIGRPLAGPPVDFGPEMARGSASERNY